MAKYPYPNLLSDTVQSLYIQQYKKLLFYHTVYSSSYSIYSTLCVIIKLHSTLYAVHAQQTASSMGLYRVLLYCLYVLSRDTQQEEQSTAVVYTHNSSYSIRQKLRVGVFCHIFMFKTFESGNDYIT